MDDLDRAEAMEAMEREAALNHHANRPRVVRRLRELRRGSGARHREGHDLAVLSGLRGGSPGGEEGGVSQFYVAERCDWSANGMTRDAAAQARRLSLPRGQVDSMEGATGKEYMWQLDSGAAVAD